MATSLHCCAPSSHSILPLRRPFAGVHDSAAAFRRPNLGAHLNFRSKKEVGVQVKKRRSPTTPVFASNTDGLDNTKASDNAPQGPPVLTILAGLVVFSVVCWIIGSMVMWVITLIVHPPPLK